jgi:hypothetical protein
VVALVVFASLAGCNKGDSFDKIRSDGFGCTKVGAGAMFVPKPGEHCFVCPDDTSMSKCAQNPLTSGCKEDPNGCGKAAK